MRAGSLIVLALFLGATGAEARELYGPEVGVVPFAMGRAYSAVADDGLALFYNPAGLALVRKVEVQPFDLRLGSNRDVARGFADVKQVAKNNSNVAAVLNQFAGRNVMADGSSVTQITLPYFAAAMTYGVHAAVDIENTAYPQTFSRYEKDLTFSVGGAVAAGERQAFRVGMRIDFTNRTGGYRALTLSEIVGSSQSIQDRFDAKGSGIGGTLGMQYRLPTGGRTEVTTSFVWSDIGKTSFGGVTQLYRPSRNEDNMTVGLAVRLPIGGRQNRRLERRYGPTRSTSALTFAFDYSYLNYGLGREQFPKHVHLGANLDLPLFSLQVGLNQSSLTYGAGFDLGIVRIAAATYAEEIGSYAGQRRDRRYLLSLGTAFGFGGFGSR